MGERKALIIGAGPAGLTAAWELMKRSDINPVVLEKSEYLGGIARTVRYKGNKIDIGGHRFFSKSDRVMKWWMQIMPVESSADGAHSITHQGKSRDVAASGPGPDPLRDDRVMLIRNRKSRIYFLRQFFDYPIKLSADTLRKLGLIRTIRIGFSYAGSLIHKRQPEKTLEQFLINRFGRELYLTFFKSYTEKVWGVPCDQISAEWGAQRIKGLSILKAVTHFLKKTFVSKPTTDLAQKQIETSLIEKFMYPKFGPGQLWEYVAEDVRRMGGTVETGWVVQKLHTDGFRVTSVEAVHAERGERRTFDADYFFSTMPVKELMRCLDAPVPENVREVSEGLVYRDFITVGLLLKKLKVREETPMGARLLSDNWIYVQEPEVLVGRMQIFNNWSPFLVADPENVWIGLEYFCYETDEIWKKPDDEMIALGRSEMEKIGIIDQNDVLDACVIRMPKTYPAYFGAYDRFDEVKDYISRFENLFLVGRNGMHKYNNQDHSMLTAMTAVDNILAGRVDKTNIWEINTEMEYHEDKQAAKASR
jgi:protoporphyrinogen oxidase